MLAHLHVEPEPEPEPIGPTTSLQTDEVAAAIVAEDEAWRAAQKEETAKALAILDELQAERDEDDRAYIERIRSRSGTSGMAYGSPVADLRARHRTTELLGKIGSLKKDVAQLDEELRWEAAKAQSAEGAARTAQVRMDAEARAAANAAAVEHARAEAEAEAAARADAVAAAAARERAQQESEEAACRAEAAAQAAVARRAAAETARMARLDGVLDLHGERWREAGEGGYAAIIQRSYRRHKLKVDTVAALMQKEDDEFLAKQRCVQRVQRKEKESEGEGARQRGREPRQLHATIASCFHVLMVVATVLLRSATAHSRCLNVDCVAEPRQRRRWQCWTVCKLSVTKKMLHT